MGPLFDIFGPRWLLIVGTVATVLGLMMLSICKEYYQFFLAQGILTAMGVSLTYHRPLWKTNWSFQTGVMSVNTWFLRRRGLAMGITASGASLGGVIFPLMLKRLFNSVGFSWGVRIESFLTLGLLIIANNLVKSRLPPPGWTEGRQVFDFQALKEPVFCFVMVYPWMSCLFSLHPSFVIGEPLHRLHL